MRVIKVYKPCEQCKGTGLEWQDQYSWDCRVCQGYGEVMVSKRKEFENEQTNDRPKG
jgi:DnaJ-class molecular chaperone